MTRRQFLSFFLIGRFISLFYRKIKTVGKPELKEARFWKKANES